MLRIVKNGAELFEYGREINMDACNLEYKKAYKESDTTDIPDNWRPANWREQNGDISDCPFFDDSTGDPIICSQRFNDYEAGADAMLEALRRMK